MNEVKSMNVITECFHQEPCRKYLLRKTILVCDTLIHSSVMLSIVAQLYNFDQMILMGRHIVQCLLV